MQSGPSIIALAAAIAAGSAAAQTSPEFPRGGSYIIQLTSSQYASGLGEYLVPPLEKAFRQTGMRYEGGPEAQFAATVETKSDVGSWYGTGDAKVWLYERSITVGLTPAEVDVEPEGKLSPSFSVTVRMLTPDADRVDEMNCLIALATRELSARYKPRGHVLVNGSGCARP
jgi:hypothetical protein